MCSSDLATLPGIVSELDLSGTALGWFPAGEAITGERLQAGDVLIGLPSSGAHSNGYTLLRAVVEKSGAALEEEAPFDAIHEHREIERTMSAERADRKSTRLNSSHALISYAVFCLKKKNITHPPPPPPTQNKTTNLHNNHV